jgi:hypothetical protein
MRRTTEAPLAKITSGAALNSFVAAAPCPLGIPHAPKILDLNVAADRPSQILESFPERIGTNLTFRIILGIQHQRADPPHTIGLLRPRC